MKMKKTRLALYVVLACLLLSSALGTAYAKYTSDHEMEKFKVYVTAGTVDLSVSGGEYPVVVPGTTIPLTTPPTVTVTANSEACYVFLKVTNNVNTEVVSFDVDTDNWTQLKDEDGNDIVGVYYKDITARTIANTELNVVSGNSISVPPTATREQIGNIKAENNNNTIVFTAYAVQKTIGIETPIAAWNALLPTN